MKASAVSTITKSLPIALSVLVNYSLLATLGYINLFFEKYKNFLSPHAARKTIWVFLIHRLIATFKL